MICARCNRDRPHKARSLCHSCYVMAVRNQAQGEYRRKGHSHLRVFGTRQQKRRKNAKLTRRQIHAAHVLYEGGMSVPKIAEKLWERFRFSTAHDCATSLYRAFELDGLKRDHARSMRRLYAARGCAGCGGPTDEQSRGCHTCAVRMWSRRQKEKTPQPGPGGMEEAA